MSRCAPPSGTSRRPGRNRGLAWTEALPFADFLRQQPVPSSEPSEKTELRVFYDRDALDIGAVCFDGDPSRVAAKCMARDRFQPYRGVDDDVVRILLDLFKDRRNAYSVIANACGARGRTGAFDPRRRIP
jgi:hypothetical protein